jgi:hypothetical protein
MASDHPATVMADDCEPLQLEQVCGASDRIDVLIDRERAVRGEPARSGAREVEQVTGDVFGQIRQERSKRCPAHRPSVHEEHIGT